MDDTPGITVDPLAVGPTRPTMKWGVVWQAMVFNFLVSAEAVVFTHKLQWFLICLPIHGVFWLICAHDPRAFELLYLWFKTKLKNMYDTRSLESTYSPLARRKPAGLMDRMQTAPQRMTQRLVRLIRRKQ